MRLNYVNNYIVITYMKNTKYGKRKSAKSTAIAKTKKPRRIMADKIFDKTLSFLLYNNFTTQGGAYMSNTKNNATQGNFLFRVNLIPGLSPYPNVFTHYRFNWIKLRFIPTTIDMQVEDNDVGTSASAIAKQTPLIYVTRVYGNEKPSDLEYNNEDQCLLENTRAHKMTQGFSMKFTPNSLDASQTNRSVTSLVNPAFSVVKNRWYSFASPDVNFYGVKWLISNTTSDSQEFQYRIVATASLSFKGQDDGTTSSIEGSSITVIAPIA